MPHVTSHGARIHYEVEGAGPRTVLLIMGLGGHATEWGSAFPTALAQRHRVVRMDNRGIAASETDVAKWGMQDMADDARAVLDAVGVERAHVIGTSMGGMIAQQLTVSHANRVDRLVLMATSFGGAEAVPPADVALALFAPAPELSLAEQRRRALGVITARGFAERNREQIEQLVALRERVPTRGSVFQTQLEAIFQSDRSQAVRTIARPTLVIHGVDDTLVPVGNGKLLAERIPGAKLALLEDCGHLPHLELPGRSAELALSFFDEAS